MCACFYSCVGGDEGDRAAQQPEADGPVGEAAEGAGPAVRDQPHLRPAPPDPRQLQSQHRLCTGTTSLAIGHAFKRFTRSIDRSIAAAY